MTDILDKKDVIVLVNQFYYQVRTDELIGPIFNAKIGDSNWPAHLSKMHGFWNTVLFGAVEYRGNPFSHHVRLGIKKEHFDRWISLFEKTVRDLFSGEKANEAILRAKKMRLMFETKLRAVDEDFKSIM